MTTKKTYIQTSIPGVLCYPRVTEGTQQEFPEGNGNWSWSTQLLIPKEDTQAYNMVMNAILEAIKSEWPEERTRPKSLRQPLKDGDKPLAESGTEVSPFAVGHWVLTAKMKCKTAAGVAQLPPLVIYKNKLGIETTATDAMQDRLKLGGTHVDLRCSFGAYNNTSNKGISCLLGSIKIRKWGTPISMSSEEINLKRALSAQSTGREEANIEDFEVSDDIF